ncbi:MAG: IclR family transcriptional regulator [Sphaerochaeta sp.]|nr:MAG: IclR family transcriptional regulator [Sphaerochaeta sp.]
MAKAPTVQSLDRTFDILEVLGSSQEGRTLAMITDDLKLPKSTVHRLLSVLISREYVRKNDETGRYQLGPGFISLSANYLNNLELKTESAPHLAELSASTGNTVFLGIRRGTKMVYIDSKEQINSLRKYEIIGQRKSLYSTGLGKALLLGLEEDEIRELLADEVFVPYGPNTHPNLDALLADIRVSKERGWTVDDQEAEKAINCVAAPIYDYRGQIIAAVSASWLLAQRPELTPALMAPSVVRCALNISYSMGYFRAKP